MVKEKKVGQRLFFQELFLISTIFESQGEIYGEYHPKIWENAYGVVVNVKQGWYYLCSKKTVQKERERKLQETI